MSIHFGKLITPPSYPPPEHPFHKVDVVALGEKDYGYMREGYSLYGMYYPREEGTISDHFRVSVSNHLRHKQIDIKEESGRLSIRLSDMEDGGIPSNSRMIQWDAVLADLDPVVVEMIQDALSLREDCKQRFDRQA
jgi:hypothetical protein